MPSTSGERKVATLGERESAIESDVRPVER